MMHLYVLSDLHIWGPKDPIYRSMLSLLAQSPGSGDTVVLAGDVFDFFVGNKAILRARYQEFFDTLRSLVKKRVQVHYIEGNHDFHLRRAFAEIPEVLVHSDEVPLELSGKRFYVSHGDRVDPHDLKYRFLRLFFRSPIIKGFVALAPGHWVDFIGQKSSQLSRAKSSSTDNEKVGESILRLRTLYRNYAVEKMMQGYDYVIMGHCHDLDEMNFKIGNRCGQYINMGYPRIHGSYLIWESGDEKVTRQALPPDLASSS